MRRNPSTVVVLAHPAPEELLAAVDRALNVVLVRPANSGAGEIEAAAAALRHAAGISAPYVLVAADPLAAVAAAWQAMWEVSAEPRGGEEFELRAAEALDAWRAGRFELPDYYLALAEPTAPGQDPPPDFYLGPLRSVRPHRVAVAAAAEPAEQAAGVLAALGSLRHGRWWPPLDEIFGTSRGFYPGALAESGPGLATGRLALLPPDAAPQRGRGGGLVGCGRPPLAHRHDARRERCRAPEDDLDDLRRSRQRLTIGGPPGPGGCRDPQG